MKAKQLEVPVLTKFDKNMKQVRLLGKIDVEIHDASRDRKDLQDKWLEFVMSPAFKKEMPYVKALLGLGFARRELWDNPELDNLVRVAILVNPIFQNKRDLFEDPDSAIKWFQSPQPGLKGDIPWMIMHTEWGRKRVRRAINEKSKVNRCTGRFGS